MNKLLINEPPLQVLPSLAVAIGLPEAIVLQQVHYWLGASRNERDGHKWVYNTYEQWAEQFPFWKPESIRKIFKSLRDRGLILVIQAAPNSWNKTNFYTIDYDALALVSRPEDSTGRAENGTGRPEDSTASSGTIHRITPEDSTASLTEISSETSSYILPATPTGPLAAEAAPSIPVEKQDAPKPLSAYRLKLTEAKAEREAIKAQKAQEAAAAKAAQVDMRKATWAAFDDAYQRRYGTTLTRNATTNGQMASLVARLGQEAPGVASFYLGINDAFVVRNTHGLGLLLNGAESYRTQWATGQAMTATRAQQADKTQSNFDSAQQAKAMLRARRQEQRNAE